MSFTNTSTLAKVTKKMEQYCAYQERCLQEVAEKLKRMQMPPEAVARITAHLIRENYLNEARFSRSFARGKFHHKKWGKTRIVRELKQRHIPPRHIKSALAEIEEGEYYRILDKLARKRWAQIPDTSLQKRKKKLVDYLLYRGWESHLVYEKLQELV